MTINVDMTDLGQAQEEVQTQMEYGPPPEFDSKVEALEWAAENLPIGIYFEILSKNGRVIWHGNNRMSE